MYCEAGRLKQSRETEKQNNRERWRNESTRACKGGRHGRALYDGLGMEKDVAKATQWMTKAALQDQFNAMLDLAERYERGAGVQRKRALLLEWYERGAERGHLDTQNLLAYRYHVGDGVSRDSVRAACWYEKAARHGDAWAQYQLGVACLSADGLPQNTLRTMEHLHAAAEQGVDAAQWLYGQLLADSAENQAELREAVLWLRRTRAGCGLCAGRNRRGVREYPLGMPRALASGAIAFKTGNICGQVLHRPTFKRAELPSRSFE